MEHIKILSAVFNLIIGTWAAVYAYHMYRTYAYPFLQPLVYHIVFYNILILFTLISKYFDINLPENFILNKFSLYEDLGFIFIYLSIIGMTYAMIMVVLRFRGKDILPRFKKWILAGSVILICGLIIKMVLPQKAMVYNWLDFFYENFGIIFFVLEIVFLVSLLVYGKRCGDRKKTKIINMFGYLYLSRYFIASILLFLPGQVRFFASIAGLILFNLFPVLWLKFFLLKYAQSMLSLVGDRSNLEILYKKYNISKREQEILRLIVDGKSNKEIEDELYISIHTVKNHIYSMYRKLGVKTRHQLVHLITKFNYKNK